MQERIVIIGAGISGLAAGVYARKSGFDTVICEAQDHVGGECTGWERGGYRFDGCIHWLTGSKPGTDLYDIWQTCGALGDGVEVVNHDYRVAFFDGDETYYLYDDPERLRGELKRLSPGDGDKIDELIKFTKAFADMSMPAKKPFDLMGAADKLKLGLKYLPAGAAYKAGSKVTVEDYLSGFKSEKLKAMISAVVPMHYSVSALFATLGSIGGGDGGWPMGGSKALAERMKERYLSLGGELRLSTRVKNIEIKGDKATGVAVAGPGGREEVIPADFCISAVDARLLLDKLLGGKYRDRFYEERYGDQKTYPLMTAVGVCLGVKADLSPLPHCSVFIPEKPFDAGGGSEKYIIFKHYCYDPSFCGESKSSVEVLFMNADYDYWRALREKSDEEYRKEKRRFADDVIALLCARYPIFDGAVEVADVFTPLTYERCCGAYRGAFMSFPMTPGANGSNHPAAVEGIDNLYVAGQWIGLTGGLPTAAAAGKFAVQHILKTLGKNVDI